MTLRVAIVHYHLRRGGVTRVIESATRALENRDVSTVVFGGEAADDGVDLPRVEVAPALGYATESVADTRVDAAELSARAKRALGGPPDLWHVHNHSLGKNAATPAWINDLAADGTALLLQIHDFAEDQRADNFAFLAEHLGSDENGPSLYPNLPNVHYAVLNGRDRENLLTAGFEPTRVHLLPNAVDVVADEQADQATPPRARPAPSTESLVLYPTRAIRRKNLGEFLLWSALSDTDAIFATTLEPESPHEVPAYRRWVEFAENLELPVRFAVGKLPERSFSDWVEASTALVTTSIAEGFGLAFLEPFLFGKPLRGRNIRAITADFVAVGLDLADLYERLDVPLDWLDSKALEAQMRQALSETYAAYGRESIDDTFEQAWGAAVSTSGDRIDFGRLSESNQQTIIERVRHSSVARTELEVTSLELGTGDGERIEHNAGVVRRHFGLEAYGERLLDLYNKTVESERGTAPEYYCTNAVVDAFLDPHAFYLLRSGYVP